MDPNDDGLDQFRGCLWLVLFGAVILGAATGAGWMGWMVSEVRDVCSL